MGDFLLRGMGSGKGREQMVGGCKGESLYRVLAVRVAVWLSGNVLYSLEMSC
jgi:hypothetical protein